MRRTAVFKDAPGVLVTSDILRRLSRNIVQQKGLAMFDTPYRQLILVIQAARVWFVALAVFNGEAVFDDVLLRAVQADAENCGVHDLIYALIELKQNGVEIERSGNLTADL